MSDIKDEPTRFVLHIRASTSVRGGGTQPSAAMEALLQSLLPGMVASDNVYDGLARLCAAEAKSLQAAVVCMDGVGSAELEFFTLVARLRKDVAVYVYGGDRQEQRITTAIRLGAKGRATEEAVRALADAPAPADHPVTGDSAPPDPLQPPPEPHPVVVVDDQDDDKTEDAWTADPDTEDVDTENLEAETVEDETVEDEDADTQDTPIRVPWLRYEDCPARTAPPRRGPAHSSGARDESEENADATPGPHAPLVTDAELQALLGDDIAAIAPSSPNDSGSNHHDEPEHPR